MSHDDRLEYAYSNDDDIIFESQPESYNVYRRSNVLNIAHEVQRLVTGMYDSQLDTEIIMLACDEFHRLNMRFRRGRRWLTAIYHCIDVAHRELSVPMEPVEWIERLGISIKDVTQFADLLVCSSMNIEMPIEEDLMFCECVDECSCEYLGENYIVFMDPCYFIEDYCNRLGLFSEIVPTDIPDELSELSDYTFEDHMDSMERISDVVKRYIDDYPQVLAIGIIAYYTDLLNMVNRATIIDELLEYASKSQPAVMRVIRVIRDLTRP